MLRFFTAEFAAALFVIALDKFVIHTSVTEFVAALAGVIIVAPVLTAIFKTERVFPAVLVFVFFAVALSIPKMSLGISRTDHISWFIGAALLGALVASFVDIPSKPRVVGDL